MVLEETLNSVHNESELLASRADIAHQLATIDKLVASTVKMETQLGSLLAKPTLLKIAGDIVQILLAKLQDVPNHEILIDEISAEILKTITNVNENESSK
jgi:hypothetical protein